MRGARAVARAAQPTNTVRSTSLVARAAPPPPPQAIASPRATAQQLTVPACARRYGIACLQQRRHHDVEHVRGVHGLLRIRDTGYRLQSWGPGERKPCLCAATPFSTAAVAVAASALAVAAAASASS
eukprot:scaffold51572_cov67-Phaeocystis_antarctica.AAC.8